MSKTEILEELPKLRPDELAKIRAKLDELTGEVWCDQGELSVADKAALEEGLVDYFNDRNSAVPWDEVKADIERKLSK